MAEESTETEQPQKPQGVEVPTEVYVEVLEAFLEEERRKNLVLATINAQQRNQLAQQAQIIEELGGAETTVVPSDPGEIRTSTPGKKEKVKRSGPSRR